MAIKIDSAGASFLASLAATEDRMKTVNQQVSSGVRVSGVGDDPQGVPALLELQSQIGMVSQVQQNLASVRAEVDTSESTLEDAVRLVEQARVLGAQGANGLNAGTSRPLLAQQVESLLTQMVGLSQVQVDGRYVFSGDADQSPVYELDLTAPSGVDQLSNPGATKLIQHPNGTTFAAAKTAQEIFDLQSGGVPLQGNVFHALNALRVALAANNSAGISSALDEVQAAGDYLNQQLGWYGDLQNRIAKASDLADKFQAQAAGRLSELRDADMPAAIVELTQSQTQQQAALSAEGQRSHFSLFDFLR